jgi:hypothetical protein
VGGFAEFSKMIRLAGFSIISTPSRKRPSKDSIANWQHRLGMRTIVKARDEIPLKGVRVLVVPDQRLLARPFNRGRPNPFCADAEQTAPVSPEKQRTVGML